MMEAGATAQLVLVGSALQRQLCTLAGRAWETARMCFARGDILPVELTSRYASAADFFFAAAGAILELVGVCHVTQSVSS